MDLSAAADPALLEDNARTKDAEAFAELVGRYAGLVCGVCPRATGSAHDAEDATQECLIELARAAGSITGSVAGWLHAVAMSRTSIQIPADCRLHCRAQLRLHG